MARYRDARIGACLEVAIETRADGTEVLRSPVALHPYPLRLTDRLEHWAREAPQRTFAARRGPDGQWRRIGYAEMRERARAVAAALLERGCSVERPVAILSENDLEHLTLALGAMYAGVPYAPISPAYSLISRDHARLRFVLGKLTPSLVYAATPAYAAAIAAAVPPDAEVVLGQGALADRPHTPFDALLATAPGPALDAAHAHVGPDTIAKILFTSGSTKQPKGVINTHRMLCSNQQMLRQTLAFLTEEPPVLVDWLPWNHTFGGNHNVGIALYNGGTLYIDDGRPTPQGIGETVRNLREIAPTVYFNVPRGFEELAAAMQHDDTLRRSLFSRVKALFFAGAGLSQPVWDELDRLAEQTVGERIRMITGLGMTETSPSSMFAVRTDIGAGHVGLPAPGVQAKLVPVGEKLEVRFRGPHVMPGYWREPELTAAAFDEEGFYRTGDALRWIDRNDPARGLLFDGRVAEDFKLATGTFVSVGPLRARIIAAGAPYVQDAVIAAPDRNDVGALLFPRLDDCRRLAGLAADAGADAVLAAAPVRAFFQDLIDRLWREGTGSSNRVARAVVLREPPSIDKGEMTDKGSINQRAVLTHRAAIVEAMYRGEGDTLLARRTDTP